MAWESTAVSMHCQSCGLKAEDSVACPGCHNCLLWGPTWHVVLCQPRVIRAGRDFLIRRKTDAPLREVLPGEAIHSSNEVGAPIDSQALPYLHIFWCQRASRRSRNSVPLQQNPLQDLQISSWRD